MIYPGMDVNFVSSLQRRTIRTKRKQSLEWRDPWKVQQYLVEYLVVNTLLQPGASAFARWPWLLFQRGASQQLRRNSSSCGWCLFFFAIFSFVAVTNIHGQGFQIGILAVATSAKPWPHGIKEKLAHASRWCKWNLLPQPASSTSVAMSCRCSSLKGLNRIASRAPSNGLHRPRVRQMEKEAWG